MAPFIKFMSLQRPSGKPPQPASEIQHLRNALNRLEDIGETNCTTIDNLKRVVVLRLAELESRLDGKQTVNG
jgi:hypothetical protein